jgi:DNA invertase Pin-like site-specific DNA recombinase
MAVALVYVRVSRYDENAHRISSEAQLERCKALSALAGYTVEAFHDLDVSGKNTKRPAFQRMLARMRRGEVNQQRRPTLSRLRCRGTRVTTALSSSVLRPGSDRPHPLGVAGDTFDLL